MEEKNFVEKIIEESPIRKDKIKVYLKTHPSVKANIKNIDNELQEGNLTIAQYLKKMGVAEKMKLQQGQSILVFLKYCFLASPFDTLSDLYQSFGIKNNNNVKELIITLAIENAWG